MSQDRPALLRPVISRRPDKPGEALAEFRVGTGSLPWLADHCVQGIPILPGAFYLELARFIEQELCGRALCAIRDVQFDRPIILSQELVTIRAHAREHADGCVDYAFDKGGATATQPSVRLQVAPDAAAPSRADPLAVGQFQSQAAPAIEGGRAYDLLRANGNEYGPSFQRIQALWTSGARSLAKISVPRPWMGGGLHPSLVDSMVQLLIASASSRRKACVLRSIGRIDLPDGDLPETLWAFAAIEGDPNGTVLRGNVQAFDESGALRLQLAAVELALLEALDRSDAESGTKVVVAANFTAEPVEEALKFWGSRFSAPLRIEFAPYDQVFPQLLDPASVLQANRNGVNVILLRLEAWARRQREQSLLAPASADQPCFANLDQHVLPNGLRLAHWQRHETEYLYEEIFEDECYLRNGVDLPDDAVVIDVGANIGMFSLFVMSRCSAPTIYAFEPAPAIYDILKANFAAYGGKGLPINAGVASREGTATFTFYENSSVFSGFHADENSDGAALRAIIGNTLRSATSLDGGAFERQVDELASGRLRSRTHECRLTSLSELIREHRLERIDLLKVDAEKSELDVLHGIEEQDWPKFRQIVLEVHDASQQKLQSLQDVLGRKGFRCTVQREHLLEDSGFVNLFATREEASAAKCVDASRGTKNDLSRNVEDLCQALAAFRQRNAAPLVLCVTPRTPLAKRDADLGPSIDAAEAELLSRAESLPNVRTIGSSAIVRRYGLGAYYDVHGDRLGDIPYTPACHAAIGTAVFRAIQGLSPNRFKVVVLDCDNTLWRGTCGEDGPQGIALDPPYLRLQQFMVEQQRAGLLVCLCSKNSERDVFDVFEQRPDMVLRRGHLAASRINWDRKS
ncbi:MAG TPA: FkbM family methyltransferase, partial [Burkholderiales bacterium]|nr:FkbM family methyltransferase [Burkholderiales bacterium]